MTVPTEVESLIGQAHTRRVRVTERDIRKFAQAIGGPPPERRGTRGLIAPPLFYQTLAYDELPVEILPPDGSPRELDVPVPAQRAVGGSSDFEIFRYAEDGDLVDVTSRLRTVYTKEGRSGLLYFIVVETEFCADDGSVMARETATYIKRS